MEKFGYSDQGAGQLGLNISFKALLCAATQSLVIWRLIWVVDLTGQCNTMTASG
jgi:hypothetical protein